MGNHDVARDIVRGAAYVETGLKADLSNVDRLNAFIDRLPKNEDASKLALARTNNVEIHLSKISEQGVSIDSAVLKTYKFIIDGRQIGIAALNSAWRATGEAGGVDRHSLLIGERNIDNAIRDLEGCDIKVAAFHHPLDWLAEFDEISVSSRLYSEFDLLMCGHTHRPSPEVKTTTQGRAILSQAGCIFQNRDYFNGYQFIKLDFINNEAKFIIRTYYNQPQRRFDAYSNIGSSGQVTFPFMPRSSLGYPMVEAFLRATRSTIRQAAADQINLIEARGDLRLDAKEAFVCPPLTLHRSREFKPDLADPEDEITVDEILQSKDNFIIVGSRESGKTSLAHYMSVVAAEGVIDRPRIPVVIDFRRWRLVTPNITDIVPRSIIRPIATYFEASPSALDIEKRLRDGDFILFIDNFPRHEKDAYGALGRVISQYPGNRTVVLSDEVADRSKTETEQSGQFELFRLIHIQPLPRRSIRTLSRRWSGQMGRNGEEAFETIMDQLRRSNLPRTGYMVTLLLWAFHQNKRIERINEATLLTNVVDHLLGKADFTQSLRGNFDPTSKEITLQHLASVIRSGGGAMTRNETLKALIAFFDAKALDYGADIILSKLVDCGVLDEQDGYVFFKFRCFEEYFYASLLRADSKQLSDVLSGRKFLQFNRELELLAGLRRQNPDIIDALSREIVKGVPAEYAGLSLEKFDVVAKSESQVGVSRGKIADIRKSKLTAEQVDDLLDAADREIQERQSKAKQDIDNPLPEGTVVVSAPMPGIEFMNAVSLLGRVVRNSEFDDGLEKLAAAKLYLDTSLRFILYTSDIIGSLISKLSQPRENGPPIVSESEAGAVKYAITKICISGMSQVVTSQIGTQKLFRTFEQMFDDEKSSFIEKIYIGILFLDTGHPKWLEFWIKLISAAKGNRFVLDVLIDRLWEHVQSKFMDDREQEQVEDALVRLDRALGAPKDAKSALIASARKVANAARTEDALP